MARMGRGLRNVRFTRPSHNPRVCYQTMDSADIPEGGFARTYNDHVEIWRHCDQCSRDKDYLGSYRYEKYDCDGLL